ncbi:MAG TPA: hypothetical protein VLM78_02670 [Anaerolineales bacterium]|nr:hypothetical protein [Anaerolineales bacterium]
MDKFSVNWRRIGVFVGMAVLVLIVIEFNARLDELNQLTDEANVYRAQATQAMQTQTAMETQVAYAGSDAAVEDYARDNHMIQEGDIPGVPYGIEDGTVISTPTPVPTSTPVPNWQVWWNLFFGE